jgi:hypothetical protein
MAAGVKDWLSGKRSAISGQLYELKQLVVLFQSINRYRPDLISPGFC